MNDLKQNQALGTLSILGVTGNGLQSFEHEEDSSL